MRWSLSRTLTRSLLLLASILRLIAKEPLKSALWQQTIRIVTRKQARAAQLQSMELATRALRTMTRVALPLKRNLVVLDLVAAAQAQHLVVEADQAVEVALAMPLSQGVDQPAKGVKLVRQLPPQVLEERAVNSPPSQVSSLLKHLLSPT